MEPKAAPPMPPVWAHVLVLLNFLRALAAVAGLVLLACPLLPAVSPDASPPLLQLLGFAADAMKGTAKDLSTLQRVEVFVVAIMVFDQIARLGLVTKVAWHLIQTGAIIGGTALVAALASSSKSDTHLLATAAQAYIALTLATHVASLVLAGRAAAVRTLLMLAGMVGFVALCLLHGYGDTPPVEPHILHWMLGAAVAVFLAERVVQWLLAEDRRAFFRANWPDFAVPGAMAVLAAGLAGSSWMREHSNPAATASALVALSLAALYFVISQLHAVYQRLLAGAAMDLRAPRGVHPAWRFAGALLLAAVLGTLLLRLPVMLAIDSVPGREALSVVEALFAAGTSVTDTGVAVKDIGQTFTPYGQGVLLMLMQLGALTVMVFATSLVVQMARLFEADAESPLVPAADLGAQTRRAVRGVLLLTFVLEAVGAVLLYPMFEGAPSATHAAMGPAEAAWYSVFHSVSAFCNAGFSLYGANLGASGEAWRSPLRENWQVLGVLAPLVVLGGVGWFVLQDLWRFVRARVRPPGEGLHRPRLTMVSKLALSATGVLLVLGAGGMCAVEYASNGAAGAGSERGAVEEAKGDWLAMHDAQRLEHATFQSIAARSSGLHTIDCAGLSTSGKLWLSGLMLVGGTPGSAAGGMGTLAAAMLVLVAVAAIRRRHGASAFWRPVPSTIVLRLTGMALLYLAFVAIVTLLVAREARKEPFADLLLDVCSACGNAGLTTGVTAHMGDGPRTYLLLAMLVGRTAPLMMLMALMRPVKPPAPVPVSARLTVGQKQSLR